MWPLLWPCLSVMYSKIVGKTRPFVGICINKAIEIELVWFVGHTSISSRTFLLRSMAWDPSTAADDLNICYTDTCLMDMVLLSWAFARIPVLNPQRGPRRNHIPIWGCNCDCIHTSQTWLSPSLTYHIYWQSFKLIWCLCFTCLW